MPSRPLRRTTARSPRPPTTTSRPDLDSWWPWSTSSTGSVSCPESAVVLDALQRRVTASGTLRSCCVEKISRVLDLVMAIAPGDTSIDLTAVLLLEPGVAAAMLTGRDRWAARGLRLNIVGASSAVVGVLDV